MIDLNEVFSLTEFQRNAKDHVERLARTGKPQVLTVNGKAEAVVQDAKSYQELLELIDRAEAIEGIRRGLEDVKKGRTKSARKFFDEMRREFKIARRA